MDISSYRVASLQKTENLVNSGQTTFELGGKGKKITKPFIKMYGQ